MTGKEPTSPAVTARDSVQIDAAGLTTQQLNDLLRRAVADGIKKIELRNVCGQRYIGTDLGQPVEIDIYGTPGNDLGSFMDGPRIRVHGNAQDGCGNTMNHGEIVVYGHAGDITGLSARDGKIFVRDYVGYRAAIHMKEYQERKPALVIGGTAQDFLGEYMAGGTVIVLGMELKPGEKHRARFIGTGMHGGAIYLRGEVEKYQLGKEVGVKELDDNDRAALGSLVGEFARHFSYEAEALLQGKFIKLVPLYLRPYGRLYAYG
ncbi:MAG: hypothetical protein Q8P00_06140 [Dehalococcoidia bacterium]|nr:hypothetical protein [Dehalococcoidia bacterium]